MPKFMKMLNNISRSQAIFRHRRTHANDLQPSHYPFVLAIFNNPGRSQEELARELCINKSTFTGNLTFLEEKGCIARTPCDKRRFSVYPAKKRLLVLPYVMQASEEWMELLSEGIGKDELLVFNSVLKRMRDQTREIEERQEVAR